MLDKCQHYIKSQEDACLTKVYEDRGLSGTIGPAKRPALAELLSQRASGILLLITTKKEEQGLKLNRSKRC